MVRKTSFHIASFVNFHVQPPQEENKKEKNQSGTESTYLLVFDCKLKYLTQLRQRNHRDFINRQ